MIVPYVQFSNIEQDYFSIAFEVINLLSIAYYPVYEIVMDIVICRMRSFLTIIMRFTIYTSQLFQNSNSKIPFFTL